MIGNRQPIDGKWTDARNGSTWDLVNSANGHVIDTVPYGDGSDAIAAIDAASRAFESPDEAITIANPVENGLASYVWTSNQGTAMEASDRLEYGMVGVNDWYPVTAEAPFGGVKQSGIGRESGTEGILEYLEPKTRYIRGL